MTKLFTVTYRKAGCLSIAITYLFLLNFSFGHPQDGPHVDLRWKINENSIKMRLSMNLLFADFITPPTREQLGDITDGELSVLCETIQQILIKEQLVIIDDLPVIPEPIVCLANTPDESLLPLFPESGMRGLQMLIFGFEYPLKEGNLPNQITFSWKHYPPDILSTKDNPRNIILQAELDDPEKIMQRFILSKEEPGFVWHRNRGKYDLPLPIPVIQQSKILTLHPLRWILTGTGIVFFITLIVNVSTKTIQKIKFVLFVVFTSTGLAMITGWGSRSVAPDNIADAKNIFEPLHHNIYQAFKKNSENSIYNALSEYTAPLVLDKLYREILNQLTMYDEGGAVSQINKITPKSFTLISSGVTTATSGKTPSFKVKYGWNAEGAVFHWGHAHQRTNSYLAEYTMIVIDGKWKIGEVTILDQERVDIQESKIKEI